MKRPDVIVIGGGLAGLSVAWHLSKTLQVKVVEAGRQLGAEASSQNAGMVRILDHDPVDRSLALRTERFFADLPDDWIATNPTRKTGAILSLAHDVHALHDAAAWVKAAGIPIQSIDRPGDIAPAMLDTPAKVNWYLPSARMADPHALVEGYALGVRHRGGEIQTGVVVKNLISEGGRVVGIETSHGKMWADQVVIAAGAWSAPFAAHWSPPLHPVRRTLLQTRPHPLSNSNHPWCWMDDIGCYIRPEAGGWLCSPCDETLEETPVGRESTGSPNPHHEGLLSEKINRWFPALGPVQFKSGWTGLRTFATDRRPIMGSDPHTQGIWWATGLGGFGVTTSYAVGEALSYWIQGQKTPWLESDAMHPSRRYPSKWVLFPSGDHNEAQLI